MVRAHAQPGRAKTLRSTMRGLGPQGRMRCGLSLAPCIAKRRDLLPWRMAPASPAQLDDRFAALGKHRRPGVRRGFDCLE